MKFCENCGTKLDGDSLFCEECGAKVEDSVSAASGQKDKRTIKNNKRKPLTKKQKTIAVSIIAFVLVVFLGYNVGKTVYSQENQIERITEALASKDAEKIADVVTTNDPNFEINAESLSGFTEYLDQNSNYLNEMTQNLKTNGYYDSFNILQNGKKFGLYDAYELVMNPVYGDIYTNDEDVTIYQEEEELFTSDSEDFSREVGPFAPGILTFTAEGTINDFPLSTTEEVAWLSHDSHNSVDLSLTGTNFSVSSDLESATVFLNDESIGQLEDGSGEFGPIQFEEGMQLHVGQKFEDEEIVSEKVTLDENKTHYEFNDLVLVKSSDVNELLRRFYGEADGLSTRYDSDNVEDYNVYFHPEGTAQDEYGKELLSEMETASNNEDISRVWHEWDIIELERVGATSFEVAYEVSQNISYGYFSDKDNGLRHYVIEALVTFEPTNHPDREFDGYIYEINNKELLYEEGDGLAAGSEKSDEPEEENTANEDAANEDVSNVVNDFVSNLAPAINNNDFSLISSYIDPNSAFYDEQASYVSDTHDRGITETLENVSINSVNKSGDRAKVSTSELFTIYDNGTDRTSTYEAVYDLKKVGGNYLITGMTTN